MLFENHTNQKEIGAKSSSRLHPILEEDPQENDDEWRFESVCNGKVRMNEIVTCTTIPTLQLSPTAPPHVKKWQPGHRPMALPLDNTSDGDGPISKVSCSI